MSEPLIHEGDFKSIELKISALNLETKVEVQGDERIIHIDAKKRKKSKLKEHSGVQLIEMREKGMVIEVPANFAAKDHVLELNIAIFNCPSLMHVKVEVRVEKLGYFEQLTYIKGTENVEHTEGPRDTLTVVLTDPDDVGWAKLQRIYTDRQAEIVDFFEQVKP